MLVIMFKLLTAIRYVIVLLVPIMYIYISYSLVFQSLGSF